MESSQLKWVKHLIRTPRCLLLDAQLGIQGILAYAGIMVDGSLTHLPA